MPLGGNYVPPSRDSILNKLKGLRKQGPPIRDPQAASQLSSVRSGMGTVSPAFQNQSLVGPNTAAHQDVSTVISPPLGSSSSITGVAGLPQTPGSQTTPPMVSGPPGMSPFGQPLTGHLPQSEWLPLVQTHSNIANQISEAYIRRYGTVPGGLETVVSLVNKVVNEGYPIEFVLDMIQKGYNTEDILRQAADVVDLEFGPQEAAIQRAIEEILRQSERDIGIAGNRQQIQDRLLAQIYENLQSRMAEIGGNLGQITSQGGQLSTGGFQNAMDSLRSFMDQGIASVQQGAQLAGAENALPEVLAGIEQAALPGAQLLASNMGTAASEFAGMGQAFQAGNERLRGASALQESFSRTNAANEIQALIGDILNNRNEAVLEQQGLLSDLGAQRGAALRNAVDQLRQQEYERERQERLDELEKMIAESQIGVNEAMVEISRGQLDLDRERLELDRLMGMEDIRLRDMLITAQVAEIHAQIRSMGVSDELARAQIEALLAETSLTDVERQQILAQIDLINAQTDQIQNETEQAEELPPIATTPAIPTGPGFIPGPGGPIPVSELRGNSGADQYIAAKGINPYNKTIAQALIHAALDLQRGQMPTGSFWVGFGPAVTQALEAFISGVHDTSSGSGAAPVLPSDMSIEQVIEHFINIMGPDFGALFNTDVRTIIEILLRA